MSDSLSSAAPFSRAVGAAAAEEEEEEEEEEEAEEEEEEEEDPFLGEDTDDEAHAEAEAGAAPAGTAMACVTRPGMKAFDFRRAKDPVTAEMVIQPLIASCRQLNARPDLIVAAWLKSGIFVEADYVDAGVASHLPKYAGKRREQAADADGRSFWYLRPEDVLMTTSLKHLEKEALDKENEVASYLEALGGLATKPTALVGDAEAAAAQATALSEGEEDARCTLGQLEEEKRAAARAQSRKEKKELALKEAEAALQLAKRAARAEKRKEKRTAGKATHCLAVPAGVAVAAPDAGWAHASEAPKSPETDFDCGAEDLMSMSFDDE